MLRRRDFCAFAALSLTLSGCQLEERQTSSTLSTSPYAQDTAEDAWLPIPYTLPMFNSEVTFNVGPAVRAGERTVLRIQATTTSTEYESLSSRWSASSDNPGLSDLVMLDLGANLAFREMQTQSLNPMLSDIAPLETYAVFGATDAQAVSLYLPTVGVFADLPVLTPTDPGGFDPTEILDAALLDSERANGLSLEHYCETYANDLRLSSNGELCVLTASTDVLFKEGSFKFADDAEELLEIIAQILGTATPGTVNIVGHTADSADENATADSEQYAQVVYDQLEEMGALEGWEVNVVGVGATQPHVAAEAEEVLAINRRVEIAFTSADPTTVAFPTDASAALPKAPDDIATGATGADLLFGEQSVHISLPEVTRKDGFLYGNLSITAGDDGVSTLLGAYLTNVESAYNQRMETVDLHYAWSTWSLALLNGGARVYPVDYTVHTDGLETSFHIPLSGNLGGLSLEPGEEITVPIVWPDTGQENLILDLQAAQDRGTEAVDTAFRLVDIAVV